MAAETDEAVSGKSVGVLMFGRKRPGFDQDWSAEVREGCRRTLEGLGLACVGADEVVLDDESVNRALDAIEAANCPSLIVIQPSLADGQYALRVSQRWRGPVILWATPERPGDGKVSSCSLVGQHLWASILRRADHPFEFVYGSSDSVRDALRRAILLSDVIHQLRTAKIGAVGTHAPGFIDLAVDPFLIRTTFGIQLQPLSLPQFIERVQSTPEVDVTRDLDRVRTFGIKESEGRQPATDELLAVNSRYYVSMQSLMNEMKLDALAVQCWPELPNMIGQWPYFAVSRLSAEGHAVSIEGDIDGAIGALIGRWIGIGPGFLSDWLEHDASTIFFWHPGMAPLDMCNAVGCDEEPTLGGHFNGAKPLVVDGSLKTGSPVTVSRLWNCDGRYHWMAFEGVAVPPRRNVTGNSLLVEVDGGNVPDRFERLIHQGLPHHVTIHYGRQAASFRTLARLLKVQWHE